MAIIINGGPQEEALDYKYIHMSGLEINQPRDPASHDNPTYQVIINYRLFAIDSKGIKHFDKTARQVKIDNYLALAMDKAATGDMDLINALQGIEKALANIIEDQDEDIISAAIE